MTIFAARTARSLVDILFFHNASVTVLIEYVATVTYLIQYEKDVYDGEGIPIVPREDAKADRRQQEPRDQYMGRTRESHLTTRNLHQESTKRHNKRGRSLNGSVYACSMYLLRLKHMKIKRQQLTSQEKKNLISPPRKSKKKKI